ncbi:PACT_coil_coil domain-containing protein [Nephila pilipes]|uniref:PACT_coil_coil domain-containing protein n=1 Tax=Nephila pilipes TaxID=299642 RepID=A0A8X6PYX0_NEPPI|nr:PACT_coil_coil domain-containing protein [Nephila pilipes]
MEDDERRRKIEAGKLKLAEFKKKRHKIKTKNAVENPTPPTSTGSINLQNADKTNYSAKSSNTENLTMKTESKVPTDNEMNVNLATESSLQLSEGSDDASHLVNADSELLSLFDQKIKRYQSAMHHKDSIIQKLSDRLASTISAHTASSAGNEVKILQEEINLLHQQMKEAAEMLAKQKSAIESKNENALVEERNAMCETSVQVDVSLYSLEELLLQYSQSPDFAEKLDEFLKKNAAHIKLLNTLEEPIPSVTDIGAVDNRELSFKVLEEEQCKNISEMPSLLKKMETLTVITKLIETLVNASTTRTSIEGAGDFSCSKFQSYFLKRLNSADGETLEPDASESESQLSDMNYVEVEPAHVKSFNKSQSEASIEKLRNQIVTDDFSLVTDFLLEEMDKISSSVPYLKAGPQGDGIMTDSLESEVLPEISSAVPLQSDPDYQKFISQKSKLESKLKFLKNMSTELQESNQSNHQKYIDADTLVNSEDNILLEEPPMSCMSLLSLTDSEYRTENVLTDSETNFSRKVSFDMTRSMQDGEVCQKCDKYFELMREKYDDHMCIFKEALENNLNLEKNEAIKKLESEIIKLKMEKEDLNNETSKQVELLCQEQEMKIQYLSKEYEKQLAHLQTMLSKGDIEKGQMLLQVKSFEEELTLSNKKVNEIFDEKEKLLLEVKELEDKLTLVNKKNDENFKEKENLIESLQNHQLEMDTLKSNQAEIIEQEQKQIESQYLSTFEVLKKLHEDEIMDLKQSFSKQLEEKEKEHERAIGLIEANYSSESATYQKKIEQLLEEKCELLAKTTQEYEAILKKNHKALIMLCNHLRTQLGIQKEKIFNESHKSVNSELELNFSETLDELNRSIEDGILKFLNQNYFLSNEENFDDTDYLPLEMKAPVTEKDLPSKKNSDKFHGGLQKYEMEAEKRIHSSKSLTQLSDQAQSEGSLESDDILMIHSELNKLQDQFQKDAAMYEHINAQLLQECQGLRKQAVELEDNKRKLEVQLQEKEKELALKESQLVAVDAGSVNDAARTNFRLLHVLSDLVKTFVDIERDINSHLEKHGLIPSHPTTLVHQDEETGHSVGSREDFTSLSIAGECPNIELAEDGPDLTPRAWDVFVSAGAYDMDMEGEDVVLGASRRLKSAVDHVLNLLTRALENQQNQDLKLLLKRNEELSLELQEESEGRDALHMKVVTAESTIRKLECEKQRLEDLNHDLRENQELTKRELTAERNKLARMAHEKEIACDEVQMLKDQCEMLASRLGDPERMGTDKILNTSENYRPEQPELLQENSRLSTEKQNVQKNLSQERQSFRDRLHQMEMELDGLKAEKEEILEMKCKEIRDLKAEMEAMEKQLLSNKKFIDEQAQEREQEREEYIREITKMQDIVREKEKIQSNEIQLTKEIESLEQLLRARIEDHQNAMKKKEVVEKELRQSVDKIRDLRDVIEELEKTLDIKCKIEAELRQKLAGLTESINVQKKMNSILGDGSSKSKNTFINGESMEQVENLKEQLASQSQEIEQMSQNQTLLHELRGQIHFLEAKVEQRARFLESMHISSFTSPVLSDDNSPSGSQGSENLQLPCEDGYEMSPRSIHWLEIRRLEEKIGRLAHIDEELIKKNKDLEMQLKKMRNQQIETQHENNALQERLSEQLLQISALKSHIEEQKHCFSTPQKSQAVNDKIEELHEAFERQLEDNKKLLVELQQTHGALKALEIEVEKRDNVIRILRNDIAVAEKQTHVDTESKERLKEDSLAELTNENESTACFKLMLLEKNEELMSKAEEIEYLEKELEKFQRNSQNSSLISQELETKIKIAEELEKENVRLKSEVEILKSEVMSLNESLANVKEQLKSEQNQVETLMEEMANITQDNIEDVFSHKFDSYETCVKTLEEAKVTLSKKLSERDNRLREKNSEISSLKASIANLESSLRAAHKDLDLEQVQVDTLLQELGSLTGYQKRLEQDYDTIQEMMQQKERELATLHEETDAQMKLEAEVESLERELEEQKSIERDLKHIVKQMETTLDVSRNTLKSENAQWRLRIENLEKTHNGEIENLRKQIEVLCKNISNSEIEDIDITEIKKEIIEAANTFEPNNKAYGDLVYALLKKTVDLKLSKMSKKHEAHINEINESWENKIRMELSNKNYDFKSHCEKLEKENLLLQEKFEEQNQRLSCDKDAEWQTKLKEAETSLRQELEAKYDAELNNLKCSLDILMKEKSAAVAKAKDLNRQIKEQKLKFQAQRNHLLKEFEEKVMSVKKELQERLESKQLTETIFKQEIERLHAELNSKLEKEKRVEENHQEEIAKLHKFFEMQWVNEMKKIQEIQIEELKKLKDSKEKNVEALCNHLFSQYSERLKKLQEDYATQLAEERKLTIFQHKTELQTLQQALEKRFENEKLQLLEIKDREIKLLSESLEKKYNKKISDLRKDTIDHKKSSNEDGRNKWEEERLELISLHNKEISDLKHELKTKYEEYVQKHLMSHEAEMKSLEEAYSQKVEEVHELIREARRAASKSCHSDSGSNRTTTPSSEMSSDEACSSCQEDMLPGNKHILVNKIHQDGKRVLSLIENSLATTSTEREARLWIEERKWIVKRIHVLTPEIVDNQTNLKLVIGNLVDELLNARQKLVNYSEEVTKNKELCSQLEEQLDTERSKVYVIATNLSHQTKIIKELESLLNSRTSELIQLKKMLANENSPFSHNSVERDSSSQLHSENLTSSSYNVGCLRSADEQKSAEKFSMFLPEIESPHFQKSVEELETTREGMASLPQLTKELDQYLDRSVSQESISQGSRTDIYGVQEELMSILSDKRSQSSYEAKLHGLFWVYKRSMSYNKSLVYQKKYLLMLLRGFQATEKVTLAWLNRMDNDISPRPPGENSVISDPPLRGRSLFRSFALVVIAIQRMKFYVRRWRLLARIPSSQVVDAEIRTVFQGYSTFSPTLTPGAYNSSIFSFSSKATSISGVEHFNNSQNLMNSRSESKTKEKYCTPDKRQLIEYVHRLEMLQKQLGLDNFR